MYLRPNPPVTQRYAPPSTPRKQHAKLWRSPPLKLSQKHCKAKTIRRRLSESSLQSSSGSLTGSISSSSTDKCPSEDGTKPTFETVRMALLNPRGVNVPISASSDHLASVCNPHPYERLLADFKEVSAHPRPRPGGYGPLFPKAVTKAGQDLCKDHEGTLVELESVLRLGEKVLLNKHRASAKLSEAELRELPRQYGESLEKYKALLLEIILDRANASSSSSPSGKDKRFGIEPTKPMFVNPALHITPTERAVSRTIYDRDFHGDLANELSPVLIWYTNKDPYPTYKAFSLSSTIGSLYTELSGQYLLRRAKADYHQGVLFDGFTARFRAISVKAKRDILAEHKTHMIFSNYSFRQHRPEFVLDMVNLLRDGQDPRKMYNHTLYKFVHDNNTDEFEEALLWSSLAPCHERNDLSNDCSNGYRLDDASFGVCRHVRESHASELAFAPPNKAASLAALFSLQLRFNGPFVFGVMSAICRE